MRESRRHDLRHGVQAIIGAVTAMGAPLWASSAHAHVVLLGADLPIDGVVDHPPRSLELRFNEPVEIIFGSVRVFDADGDRVDSGEAPHADGRNDAIGIDLEHGLDDSTYTVTWRVVGSADAHPIDGVFVFHVGAPGARPKASSTSSSPRPETTAAPRSRSAPPRGGGRSSFSPVTRHSPWSGGVARSAGSWSGRTPSPPSSSPSPRCPRTCSPRVATW